MYKDNTGLEHKCIQNSNGARFYLLRCKIEEQYMYVAAFIDLKIVVQFDCNSNIDFDGMIINPYDEENSKDISGYLIRKPQKVQAILVAKNTKVYNYSRYDRNKNEIIGNVVFIRFLFENVLKNADMVQVIYFN